MGALIDAYAYDVNIRNAEAAPDARREIADLIAVHDLLPPAASGATADRTAPEMEPFPVFEDDRVRVTAVTVPHGPVFPSFAFRFDTDEGSVTFSTPHA